MLQPENIENTLHAYQMAKRYNVKRVMADFIIDGGATASFFYGPLQPEN